MNIIILGAGQVGSSLATSLQRDHDITIIDTNSDKLEKLHTHYDLKTICGLASDPTVLDEAGTSGADLLIAVTNNDEVNIVACQIAHSLYSTPTKIARLRNKNYRKYTKIFNDNNIPIDFVINPSEYITTIIKALIDYPGSFQVVDFAKGELKMIGAKVASNASLVDMTVKYFREELASIDTRIMTICRNKRPININGDTIFQEDDLVYFLAKSNSAAAILAEFQPDVTQYRKIMICGAGNIGLSLAQNLENEYDIKIIESNYDQCHIAAEILSNTTILHGQASDMSLLSSENIDSMDLYCSVTDDDETNIMSSILAKSMGANHTMSLVNSLSYIELIDKSHAIDRTVSPKRISISVIQTYLRKGDIMNIHALYGGFGEAIEIKVHADRRGALVKGMRICDLNIPESIRIGAAIRNNKVYIVNNEFKIEANDRLVLTINDLDKVHILERLFQSSSLFL